MVTSPWQVEHLRQRRIARILSALAGRELTLVIDETGDRKKGHATDYVKRQYIGNLGKVENGIVSVDAYGVINNITFPLTSEVYKPKARDYMPIEKWWELVMSAYLMVMLHTPPMHPEGTVATQFNNSVIVSAFTQHSFWNKGNGWKNWLNNLRLILLPWVSANQLKPWLMVFPIP